jgi:predicted enzyme related to lactoylglutathione lyase
MTLPIKSPVVFPFHTSARYPMTTAKFCRIAVIADDMASFTEELGTLLGIRFVSPSLDKEFSSITVTFGEHGLEPIQLHEAVPFASFGRLIEVAIDVADAEETRRKFEARGYRPIVNNFLPAPGAYEYLFGRDFHGLPLMVCTAGDNEAQMRLDGPFRELDAAPNPKIGCVSLIVDNLAGVADDLSELFGMTFVDTDPAGLGARALVGPHRVKLVEGPAPERLADYELPLAAIEFAVDDVEASRRRIEAAGYPVRHVRPLASGGNAYYFGATVQRVPLSIYPASADDEIIGRH